MKGPAPAPEQAAPAKPAAGSDAILLGKTNTEGGEAKRNENIQFNQIDNNAAKEVAQRMGTSATIISEFKVERS